MSNPDQPLVSRCLIRPRTVVRFDHGRKKEHNNVEPQPFGVERAQEIWADRGPQWYLTMSIEEEAYVLCVWDAMPGNRCFMDAFFRIFNGRVNLNGEFV